MADDEQRNEREKPANDNHAADSEVSGGKVDASQRLDTVVLSIARLIGRQMARDDFAALVAANDNRADSVDSAGDDEG